MLTRYLEDLRLRALQQAAVDDARNLDIHFGRVQPEDPFAGITDDISEMVGATAAPRQWLERAEYDANVSRMLPTEQPQPPLVDMLAANDRSRALVNARLDRLTPEQQARSLPFIGRQDEAAASARRAAAAEAARRWDKTFPPVAAAAAAVPAAAAGAYAWSRGTADDRAKRQANNDLADMVRVRGIDATPKPAWKLEPQTGDPDLTGREEDILPQRLDIGEDDLITDLPKVDLGDDMLVPATPPIADLFAEDDPVYLPPDPPAVAAAARPGPSAPVRQKSDLETLPGPQLRSIKALMRAGIPERRARDIILKGSSMSPAEYRAVTGVKR